MPRPEPVAAIVALSGADQVSSGHICGRQLLVHMAIYTPVGGGAASSNDTTKMDNLRVIVNKVPDLLDSFLEEVVAFQSARSREGGLWWVS